MIRWHEISKRRRGQRWAVIQRGPLVLLLVLLVSGAFQIASANTFPRILYLGLATGVIGWLYFVAFFSISAFLADRADAKSSRRIDVGDAQQQ